MPITINGSGTVTGISAGGLPDAIITQPELATGVAGTGPAFSAYKNASQTISSSTWTKVQFQLEEFDTASAFDNATNYRFQPQVAGYYSVTAELDIFASGSPITNTVISIYKNGSDFKRGTGASATATEVYALAASLIYLNGSTDYIECYVNITSVGTILVPSSNSYSYFQAAMVRAA